MASLIERLTNIARRKLIKDLEEEGDFLFLGVEQAVEHRHNRSYEMVVAYVPKSNRSVHRRTITVYERDLVEEM